MQEEEGYVILPNGWKLPVLTDAQSKALDDLLDGRVRVPTECETCECPLDYTTWPPGCSC